MTRPRQGGRSALLALCTVLFAVCGCGAPAARENAAIRTGMAFEEALATGDHALACVLLAPSTRRQLVQDQQQDCPRAIAGEELPRGGGLRGAEAYGRQAMLRLTGDTLFLSQFTDGWKVVAAGCAPEGDKPYECSVKGS